jgi:hypothetical protein
MKSSLDATIKLRCYSSTSRLDCSADGVVANTCSSARVEFARLLLPLQQRTLGI